MAKKIKTLNGYSIGDTFEAIKEFPIGDYLTRFERYESAIKKGMIAQITDILEDGRYEMTILNAMILKEGKQRYYTREIEGRYRKLELK